MALNTRSEKPEQVFDITGLDEIDVENIPSSDGIPVLYDEKYAPDVFWKPDPYDGYVPRGFIGELVYYMRGMEVPTAYVIWSALFALSTAVKREAWLKWFPKPLYLNLYAIIVGPAGVVKKSAAVDICLTLLEKVQENVQDPNIAKMKTYTFVKNKLTPEAMLDSFLPKHKRGGTFNLTDEEGNMVIGDDGKAVKYRATSETAIILHEMAVSISKKSYAESMIELLLDLFDAHDEWEWKTLSRGPQKLRNLYTTFIAATTPTGFRMSVPEAAAGDGFLSRTVVVYQDRTERIYARPKEVKGSPTMNTLAKHLAWIVENCLGEFDLAPEAWDLYESWYNTFKKRLQEDTLNQGMRSRMDVLLLKVATLIRMSRLTTPDNVVSVEDMHAAITLIAKTFEDSKRVMYSVLGTENAASVGTLERFLKRRGSATRKEVLRNTSLSAEEVNSAVETLRQTHAVLIYLKGEIMENVSKNADEVYTYVPTVEED